MAVASPGLGRLAEYVGQRGFKIGVPKTDGATDYSWNVASDEGVIAVFTSNVPIVYISGKSINHIETDAFNERFGDQIYPFTAKLPKPDRRYKVWMRCVRCYVDWVLGLHVAPAASELQVAIAFAPPLVDNAGAETKSKRIAENRARALERKRQGESAQAAPGAPRLPPVAEDEEDLSGAPAAAPYVCSGRGGPLGWARYG